MKIAGHFLLILMLSYSLLACSSPKAMEKAAEQAKPFPLGDYQYTGYDQNGDKLIEGTISLTSIESRRIQNEESKQLKGNWQLKKVKAVDRIGNQEGTGELIGSILNGEFYIDLNPNISDANVILKGTIEGKRFHGTWSFNGYAGSLAQGTFEAIRK